MSGKEWLVPGAEIAVYTTGGGNGSRHLRLTKVLRVATQSFTVEGVSDRFRLESMTTKSTGGTWNNWHYVATQPGSDEALRIAAADERDRLQSRVWPYLNNHSESLERVNEAINDLRQWRQVLLKEATP